MALLLPSLALLGLLLTALAGLLATRLRRLRRTSAAREAELTGQLAELAAECAELARTAARDPLTGVWNHRHLQLALEREVHRCQRANGDPGPELAVVLLEIEGFEAINAEHGRHRAQAVLRDLAQRLSLEVRRSDTLGRYGGTEFLVVLPDTGAAGAAKVAERLCWAVRRHRLLDWAGEPWQAQSRAAGGNGLRAVAGTAVLPLGGHPVPLLRAADRSLAEAKRASGRAVAPSGHGNLSACADPGPTAPTGAARPVVAVTCTDEVRS
ncbi:GGDEF domain-containing protein [Streptomyces tateyamensis]|uniref:GGDEF domain-containing protein n=1 Tax=Streptomyces tateyamensis TaxID=565073 RepID=A0A2V4PG50_9ACTN|nr:GGDEF domain-containing protein [Streptomyces tateyamensis]PYC82672.1 GGDEF domain-containing protein [Streptomyces tateyamensis]